MDGSDGRVPYTLLSLWWSHVATRLTRGPGAAPAHQLQRAGSREGSQNLSLQLFQVCFSLPYLPPLSLFLVFQPVII